MSEDFFFLHGSIVTWGEMRFCVCVCVCVCVCQSFLQMDGIAGQHDLTGEL